jgi:hypothetical protein
LHSYLFSFFPFGTLQIPNFIADFLPYKDDLTAAECIQKEDGTLSQEIQTDLLRALIENKFWRVKEMRQAVNKEGGVMKQVPGAMGIVTNSS